MIDKICIGCNTPFKSPNNRQKYCRRDCMIKYRPPSKTVFKKGDHPSPKTEFKKNDQRITGSNNWNWKGGKRHLSSGYIVIKTAASKNIGHYDMMEHRFIMEKYLGRKLSEDEIIHHRNGIKNDNRIENLELVIRKSHMGYVKCPHCLQSFPIR